MSFVEMAGVCKMVDLVSVIVPAYQSEKTIKRCLDSILAQSFKNFEILVILLNSGDKTKEIINSYPNKNIRIIEQKSRSGAGGARNIGINEAQGKFICFVESDDYVEPDFIEKLYSAFDDDKIDIVKARMDVCKKEKIKEAPIIASGTFSSFEEKYRCFPDGASFDKMFRASFLKDNKILFSEGLLWEDNPFLLEAAFLSRKLKVINDIIYHYCPDDWSVQYKERLKSCILPIAQRMMDFSKQNNFSSKQLKLIKQKIFSSFAKSFLHNDEVYQGLQKVCGWNFSWFFFHYRRKIKSAIKQIIKKKRG